MMRLFQKKDLLAQIGLFLLGFCGSLYVAMTPANSMMNWYNIDDAFYYYKVAQNVVTGNGFTFDQINPTNGFHPLWMVVCLGVFWLTRYNLLLPLRVLILISGMFNGLAGVFLFRLLKKSLHPAAAILGAVVWMLLPSIYNTTAVHGMETAISALFLILYLSQCVNLLHGNFSPRQRTVKLLVCGLLGALTILGRLDNLFVVFAVGFFAILGIRRINRLVVFDLVAILVAAISSVVLRFGTDSFVSNRFSVYPMLLIALLIKPFILYFFGFYSTSIKDSLIKAIVKLGFAGVVMLVLEYGLLLLGQKLGFEYLLSRLLIVMDVAISLGLVFVIRLFYFPRSRPAESQLSAWKIFVAWVKSDLVRTVRDGLVYAAPIALLIGVYMIINKIGFGTFTPVSGQIKFWWGTLENTVYSSPSNAVELLGLSPVSAKGPWSILTSPIAKAVLYVQNIFKPNSDTVSTTWFLSVLFLVFILLVFLLSRKNGYLARKSFSLLIPAMIIGCFLHFAYYSARGYAHTRYWYWIAESLVLVVLGAIFSSRLFEKTRELSGTEIPSSILLMVMVVYVLFMHTRFVVKLAPQQVSPENAANYLASTRELEKYTDEGSLIGMTGGGTTAYLIENRTIVNMDGLINSADYFQALKTGKASEFLDRLPLNYVYGKPYILLETEPYDKIFENRLVEIGYIKGGEAFTLYKYSSQR